MFEKSVSFSLTCSDYHQYKGCSMSKKKKNEQSERINIRNFYLHS